MFVFDIVFDLLLGKHFGEGQHVLGYPTSRDPMQFLVGSVIRFFGKVLFYAKRN